jgi:hypothetical protein
VFAVSLAMNRATSRSEGDDSVFLVSSKYLQVYRLSDVAMNVAYVLS